MVTVQKRPKNVIIWGQETKLKPLFSTTIDLIFTADFPITVQGLLVLLDCLIEQMLVFIVLWNPSGAKMPEKYFSFDFYNFSN